MDTETKYSETMKQVALLAFDEECTCVDTPEYAEYERKQQEDLGNVSYEERLIRWLSYPLFSELYPHAKEFVSECLRCRIIAIAENDVPDDVLEMWRQEHRGIHGY